MSDFIYTNNFVEDGKLSDMITSIYDEKKPVVTEIKSSWGTLAFSDNMYKGFKSLETDKEIVVVIGGPLLTFRDNSFISIENSNEGTLAIYSRWKDNQMCWDKDLSGPFVVLIIHKNLESIELYTDLMSFIPVFSSESEKNYTISTHIDMLALATNKTNSIDRVSLVDFILSGYVTFPFTMYEGLKQLNPSSRYTFNTSEVNQKFYWLPKEEHTSYSLKEMGKQLRNAITSYTDEITKYTNNIAQFISGGEDSRTLASLLSKFKNRDSFIFLDQMNIEGEKAKKAAEIYDANFNLRTRSPLHYLEILPNCTKLVGKGSQYFHAHTYGFHEECNLNQYDAVFGGLFSDALLKGARIKKIRGTKRFPFIPHIKDQSFTNALKYNNKLFKEDILDELHLRKVNHLNNIKEFRDESAEEWFELWPSSMNMNIPNLHANRRLFRSYEPFMTNDVVKISATSPQKWKMNRRLFRIAVKPMLKPSKWLLHSEGKLPYFPWYVNIVIGGLFWIYVEIGKKIGFIKGNQGPWASWNNVLESAKWEEMKKEYLYNNLVLRETVNIEDLNEIFDNSKLNYVQKINLMQSIYNSSENNTNY